MDEVILKIVDEKLNILGEHGKHMTYFYLEKRGIKRCEIRRKLEEFLSVLEETYSVNATMIVRKLVMNSLRELGENEEVRHILEVFRG